MRRSLVLARKATSAKSSHLQVENGRFVERPGKPIRDLTRGNARARRRLAELSAESRTILDIVIAG